MGSKQGVIKLAAARLGLTVEEYLTRIDAGQKWCTACKEWHPVATFGADISRGDGLASRCKASAYRRKTSGPGRAERQAGRRAGLSWCRLCQAWLPIADVRAGLCRKHINQLERERYAADERFRAERRQHAHSRKRGTDPMPAEGQEYRLDMFWGECAYCPNPATTWDHIMPISRGGLTSADNIAPACATCNSSKKDRDIWGWATETGRVLDLTKADILAWLCAERDG